MGQFALGIRSLLIKSAVFVVMAALLAWALGGTLWPRAQTSVSPPVYFDGYRWYWQLAVGGKTPGQSRWRLWVSDGDGKAEPFDDNLFAEVAGPIAADDGLYIAYLAPAPQSSWTIERIERVNGDFQGTQHVMPDRLAVEQQLERLRAGLSVQDMQTIMKQRHFILDPPG